MYSDRMGNGQKPPRTKSSRQKTPDKTPGQKPLPTIEREFVQGAFVLGILTIGGIRDPPIVRIRDSDVLLGSRDVWQSVTGGGWSKLAKNSVMYFMDGPFVQIQQSYSSYFEVYDYSDSCRPIGPILFQLMIANEASVPWIGIIQADTAMWNQLKIETVSSLLIIDVNGSPV